MGALYLGYKLVFGVPGHIHSKMRIDCLVVVVGLGVVSSGMFGSVESDPSDRTLPPIPLWPWPTSVLSGHTSTIVTSTSFQWHIGTTSPRYNSSTLTAAITRYEAYAFGDVDTVSGGRKACHRSKGQAGHGRNARGDPAHNINNVNSDDDVLVGLTITLAPEAIDTPLRMDGDES
jgi:hypothetical protein